MAHYLHKIKHEQPLVDHPASRGTQQKTMKQPYLIINRKGTATQQFVKAQLFESDEAIQAFIDANPDSVLVSLSAVKMAFETLVTNEADANPNIVEAKTIFNNIPDALKQEVGVLAVNFDPKMVWFTVLLQDKKTTISVAKKDDGFRVRKRFMGQEVETKTGISHNALNAAIKSVASDVE